jgi:aminoglycoside phosphotransferase (APT) family kinase protein
MNDIRHQPEVTEVRTQHQIDLEKLADYFTQHLPQFSGPLAARQFKDGQSNPTYLIKSGAQNLVLRKKPPGDLLPGAHRIEREFRIISALAGHNVPVPKAYHLCEDKTIIGTPFYVMQHVPGGVCQDPALPDMRAPERGAIYTAMAEVMAQLHSIDWAAARLGDYGKHENYVARQIFLWSRQYEAAKSGVIAEMDQLMAWLPENIPAGDETCLVHGDFRPGNLILGPENSGIAAVLDWELSTLGHPLTDLAYNCLPYYLPAGEDSILPGIKGADLNALGIPSEDAHIETYCRAAGRDGGIPSWSFYITFSMFRLASIAQGVYARALQGNASSAKAKDYDKRAIQLAKLAWALQSSD